MPAARPTTEQKLDMALEDLVERNGHKERKGKSYGPATASSSEKDGPYASKGKGKGTDSKGKGKGKGRRIPIEDKALLNTYCTVNTEKHLVVRLYETEVVKLWERVIHPPGPVTEKKAESTEKEPQPLAAGKVKPEDLPPPKPEGPGMVLVLTSGKFRTPETKYIITEVLRPLGYHLTEEGSKWLLWCDYKKPGQVNQEPATSQPFEDGMEVLIETPFATMKAVRQHMAERIKEARERAKKEKEEREKEQRHRGPPQNPPPSPYTSTHYPPPTVAYPYGTYGSLPPGSPYAPPHPAWPPPPHHGYPPPPAWGHPHWPPPPAWDGRPPPVAGGPPAEDRFQ